MYTVRVWTVQSVGVEGGGEGGAYGAYGCLRAGGGVSFSFLESLVYASLSDELLSSSLEGVPG